MFLSRSFLAKASLTIGLALGATLSAGAADAADAYAITNVSMRAGPSTAYPRITVIGAGQSVTVYGCLQDYSWCDTSTGDNRGWVAGSYLNYAYQGNRVAIPSVGAQLGLTILNFALDDYWGNYYRNRPFYGRRTYWDRHPPRPSFVRPPHRPRPPAVRPPPRPRPPAIRPPRPDPGQGTRPPRPGQGNGGRPPRPGQGSGGKPPRPNPGPGAGKPPPGQGDGGKPGSGNRPPRPTTKPAPGTQDSK